MAQTALSWSAPMADDLIVDEEVLVRARKMYDIFGRQLVFQGTVLAVTDTTADVIIRFSGVSLTLSGVPLQLVSRLSEEDI